MSDTTNAAPRSALKMLEDSVGLNDSLTRKNIELMAGYKKIQYLMNENDSVNCKLLAAIIIETMENAQACK